MMTQIFVLGSSSAYGVGGHTGWADLVKQYLHEKMYGEAGVGEKYELYNFSKPGATIDFVREAFPEQLKHYGRGQKIVVLVAVGGNNSKAENEPDNYVSTPEEYSSEMLDLLTLLKQNSDTVIFVGNGPVDETKTNPKANPLTGRKSYFTNERRRQFADITKRLCREQGIDFVGIEQSEAEWIEKYVYVDGLHPGQDGHQLIFNSVKPLLDRYI